MATWKMCRGLACVRWLVMAIVVGSMFTEATSAAEGQKAEVTRPAEKKESLADSVALSLPRAVVSSARHAAGLEDFRRTLGSSPAEPIGPAEKPKAKDMEAPAGDKSGGPLKKSNNERDGYPAFGGGTQGSGLVFPAPAPALAANADFHTVTITPALGLANAAVAADDGLSISLRALARQLETKADGLEEAKDYVAADRLRELAKSLRQEARGMEAGTLLKDPRQEANAWDGGVYHGDFGAPHIDVKPSVSSGGAP